MKTKALKTTAAIILAITTFESEAQTAENAKNQFVQIDDAKIAYRQIGKGTPLILANRMRGTLDTWDPLFLNKLAEKNTVIYFDYPGIGYSTGKLPTDFSTVANYVVKFADALKIKKFAMGGWSWGGYVTQTTLIDYPDRVTHGILIGTNPPGKVDLPIQQFWVERALKPINDLEDEEILFFEPASEASRKAAKESHDRIYARPGVVDKIPSEMPVFMEYLKGHEKMKEDKEGRFEKLAGTNVPLLIISGDNDTSVPFENWLSLVKKTKKAQLLVLDEAGHGPQHQYPELSATFTSEFIKYTK